MKFTTRDLKHKIILLITLSILSLTLTTKSKTKQIPDLTSEEEIDSLLLGTSEEDETPKPLYNKENLYEDLNFLENSYRFSNGTSNTNTTAPANPIVDLTKNVDFSGWFGVSNPHFSDPRLFPIGNKSIRKEVDFSNLSENNFLVNKMYKEGADPEMKNELMFFFRFKNGFIYFANSKKSMSVISSIRLEAVRNSDMINNKISSSDSCFEAIDHKKRGWTLCSSSIEEKKKWLCSLQKFYKQNLDAICGVVKLSDTFKSNHTGLLNNNITDIKKMFIIPQESRKCNQDWNYQNNGTDWECTCAEGLNQSPINLPSPSRAAATRMKPLFLYDIIQPIVKENSVDGLLKENEPLKIFNKEGMLRIMHSNLGKIVLPDGGVYHGEEIVFHTPAEHMINGKRFDMEIQIIHYGVSKGDISKQVVLSFLFHAKPGVFNDFLDRIDVYNLPNEIDKFKDLSASLNIPAIFYSSLNKNIFYENEQIPMKDFSFYTYDGSLSFPPCTERTTVIVAAESLPISNTFVELFKEALRKPQFFGFDGKIHNAEEHPKYNARNVQPINGRKIEYYQSQIQGLNQ